MDLAYLVSDYSATGEGRTVSALIFRPRPRFGQTREQHLEEQFNSVFDPWWTTGMRELTQYEFEEAYAWLMPKMVYDMITQEKPHGLHWHCQFHFNFS